MKKKTATHRINTHHKELHSIVINCLNTIFWRGGSHGVRAPKMEIGNTKPTMLTPTDKMVIRNSVCNTLLQGESDWELILVAAFAKDETQSFVTAHINLPQWSLIEVGTALREICEVTVRKMHETFQDQEVIELETIHHYGYLLSPTSGLDVDVVEDNLIELLSLGDFEENWKNRKMYSTKDFIDSFQFAKI